MKRWRVAAAGTGVALLAALATPAQASATLTINDADGNDYHPVTVGPATTSDGSAESHDLKSVKLETVNIGGTDMLRATFTVDGHVPQQGAGLPTDMDSDSPFYVGGSFFAMFNNENKQTNGDNPNSGCNRVPTGRVRDQQGHHGDGYYKFIGVGVNYDGAGWSHTITMGTYDPSPDGGFIFNDIESEPSMAGRYVSPSVTYSGGDSIVTVAVASDVRSADVLCSTGYHVEDFAADDRPGKYDDPLTYAGDKISNVNGLTTEDLVVVLPVTVPLSVVPGESDLKAIGGWVFQSDTTDRSTGGPVYTQGALGDLGAIDTLGDTVSCPTPTVGGTLPDNPLWAANQNQPCQLDDDIAGNAVLVEFRKSGLGFTANFA